MSDMVKRRRVMTIQEDAWEDDRIARSREQAVDCERIPRCEVCGLHECVTSVDGVGVCSEECQNEVLKKKDAQTKTNERSEMTGKETKATLGDIVQILNIRRSAIACCQQQPFFSLSSENAKTRLDEINWIQAGIESFFQKGQKAEGNNND